MIRMKQNDRLSLPTDELTHTIIGCAFQVQNALGYGFLEKVYENALALELRHAGLHLVQQHPVDVFYRGICVGQFVADLLVQQRVLVELKAVEALASVHIAQCKNYLVATGLDTCLLLNFARPKLEYKRIIRSSLASLSDTSDPSEPNPQ